jgi:hypothetical protein
MGCCGLGGPLYVLLSVANAAACLAFLAFSIECSMIHGEPVETCYDSFLAYREVNKAMLGTLFGTMRVFIFLFSAVAFSFVRDLFLFLLCLLVGAF